MVSACAEMIQFTRSQWKRRSTLFHLLPPVARAPGWYLARVIRTTALVSKVRTRTVRVGTTNMAASTPPQPRILAVECCCWDEKVPEVLPQPTQRQVRAFHIKRRARSGIARIWSFLNRLVRPHRPILFICKTPTARQGTTTPGKLDTSQSTTASTGSPSFLWPKG